MKKYFLAAMIVTAISSCGNEGQNMGHSTPIDSSNVSGAAPASYGGNNPKDDTNSTNVNDTGTKANNVHNAGTYNEIKHK